MGPISGWKNFNKPLDTILSGGQSSQKRGRPQGIGDEALLQIRVELNFVLEQRWASVGWKLQRAQTIANIRDALKLNTGINASKLDVFRREPTQKTTAAGLRSLRKAVEHACSQVHAAHEAVKACRESAERARAAAREAAPTSEAKEIQLLCEDRERNLTEACAALQGRQKRLDALRDDLEQQQAYFAQSELLEFIRSGRYSLTPANFATAMAGLPDIGWRQSYKRCLRTKQELTPGYIYEMFLAVSKMFATPASSSEAALATMQAYLLDHKNQKQYSCLEFQKTRHYLQCAIESVHDQGHAHEAIPYIIFAEYQRRRENPSQIDLLYEEENRLTDNNVQRHSRRTNTKGNP